MQYADTDMTIEISDAATRTADNERTGTFKVRVLDSPVGGMNLDKAVIVEYNDKDLQSALGRLERRELDTEGLVMLGRTLAAMLLPITAQDGVTTVRAFLQHSFSKLGPDVGLGCAYDFRLISPWCRGSMHMWSVLVEVEWTVFLLLIRASPSYVTKC